MTLSPAYELPGGGGGGGGGGDTNDFIAVYESTTDTLLADGTGADTDTIANMDTVLYNTDGDNFSLASEAIVVALAGEYRLEYMVTFNVSSGVVTQLRGVIEVDPNTTSFAQANETIAWTGGDARRIMSCVGQTQVTLVAGSKVRLKLRRNRATQTTEVNRVYTQLVVTRIRA